MSKIESPLSIENKVIIVDDVFTNLSDLQNIQSPKKIKPKNIGITPNKYRRTLGKALLIVAKIVEYSLLYSKYLPIFI
jgi:hypothetical protein